jgi:Ca-activated chloride channel homolog
MNISTHLDYEVILANRACPVCLAVHFEAPVIGQARPKPVAFCLVLDRSGSMAGEPLAKAKQAALLAVRNLRPEDNFGLVVFDDEA